MALLRCVNVPRLTFIRRCPPSGSVASSPKRGVTHQQSGPPGGGAHSAAPRCPRTCHSTPLLTSGRSGYRTRFMATKQVQGSRATSSGVTETVKGSSSPGAARRASRTGSGQRGAGHPQQMDVRPAGTHTFIDKSSFQLTVRRGRVTARRGRGKPACPQRRAGTPRPAPRAARKSRSPDVKMPSPGAASAGEFSHSR